MHCSGTRTEQKKKVKRKKKKSKKQTGEENTPAALEEAWQVVSQDLRAASFQVNTQGHSKRKRHTNTLLDTYCICCSD